MFEAEAVMKYVKEIKRSKLISNDIDKFLMRFAYFSKYPEKVRSKLMEVGTLKVFKKNEVIYH